MRGRKGGGGGGFEGESGRSGVAGAYGGCAGKLCGVVHGNALPPPHVSRIGKPHRATPSNPPEPQTQLPSGLLNLPSVAASYN